MLKIRMRAGAAMLAAGLALGTAAMPALSQDTATPPTAPATPVPAAPTPPAPPAIEPDRLAAARDLLQATNTDAQFSTVIPMMFGQLKQSIPPSGPKMQEELDKVFAEIQTQFIERRNEVLDQIANLYAAKFTADEMKALADFYRSPIGQKFIAAVPELTAEAMKMGNIWGRRIAMDAERKVRDEMRRRGFDL
jgi:hypothetical protein